jgi:hypothetical protein
VLYADRTAPCGRRRAFRILGRPVRREIQNWFGADFRNCAVNQTVDAQ